jgi:hypothetical protein
MPVDDAPVADADEAAEPDRVGYSLANLRELLIGCLEIAGAHSVIEIGSDRGILTGELLDWAGGEREIVAVDPTPHRALEALVREHPELRLVRETSLRVLPEIELADAVILDGDHNYYTLSEELRIIGERAPGADLPLLLFHDVGWPHGRRDSYYAPERIPEEQRQPLVRDASILPGEPGIVEEGLELDWAAAREGGERNGVLTAIEDFTATREDTRLVTVPAFFGLGVVWSRRRDWAPAMDELLAAWDRNPVLARLEENRVEHLVERLKAWRQMVAMHAELSRNAERIARQEAILRTLLDSGSFALAERISRVRRRGPSPVSREGIRRALED